ncbi:MAG TPA: pyridoxamine 5'-phosphate oxidase [Bacteroidia bacterium]|jgi:pyridoxamine 5'-phosphate oxidase|nr:pyridoxamine 5'-phosphate oxidase [Bacteroidia bacterium]
MEDIRSHIFKIRTDFGKDALDEKEVQANPILQFEAWFKQALEAQVYDPHVMLVTTVGQDLKPSTRVMLLRNFEEKGFIFYTNYNSHKGTQARENAFACMTFFWPELERQVRIEGVLEKQSDQESDAYFASRPRASKIGAWVSPQSKVIGSRNELDEKYAELEKRYGEEVPRPPHWGGFVLHPSQIEFWQGRPSRLHDRIRYSKQGQVWKIERIAP